jgi:hypothetical protein
VQLPKEVVYEAEEVVEDEYGLNNMSEDDAYGGPAEEDRKPCPACGEMIMATAVKCRYCGEVFDETLKRKEKILRLGRRFRPYDRGLGVLHFVRRNRLHFRNRVCNSRQAQRLEDGRRGAGGTDVLGRGPCDY